MQRSTESIKGTSPPVPLGVVVYLIAVNMPVDWNVIKAIRVFLTINRVVLLVM
jgi:acyl-CoA reductase-like NAD-dependent aldehyde dehydrogenase